LVTTIKKFISNNIAYSGSPILYLLMR